MLWIAESQLPFLKVKNVIFMTPFIRPFKFWRIVFTYLIPIVPLFVLWDGLVSVLRTYSGEEIKKMASEIDNGDSFIWETGTMKSGQITVQYALGYPRDKNALGK